MTRTVFPPPTPTTSDSTYRSLERSAQSKPAFQETIPRLAPELRPVRVHMASQQHESDECPASDEATRGVGVAVHTNGQHATSTAALASSQVSRAAPAAVLSPISRNPAGTVQSPLQGSMARLHRSILPSCSTMQPTTCTQASESLRQTLAQPLGARKGARRCGMFEDITILKRPKAKIYKPVCNHESSFVCIGLRRRYLTYITYMTYIARGCRDM